ncbi:MAG: penicillin-binding protein 2, partial [Clostridia bacterium]|nr:penicillin-binding protein 2 [Clostridia bacterium]
PSEEFDCNGSVSSDNITFGCMKSHGKVNMASALVYSCNCYFINLMEKIDSMHVVDLASSLGFGVKAEIAQGIVAYPGNLPESDELGSFAERANFSFGQGVLTATPIQIASLYSMIANSGEFRPPYLVQGFCDEKGIFNETYKLRSPYKIISKENSGWLSAFLELAARQGTGKNATTDKISVAGKTATAQSGDFSDGDERLVTWFAGFFPYESPEYSLVIMNEDGESGSKDCAPVFSDIVSNCF